MALRKPKIISASQYMSAKWRELTRDRSFTKAEVPMLVLLCQWYEIYDTALAEIDAGGGIQTAYTNDDGDIKALPQLSTMARASSEIRAISKQLGLFEKTEEQPKRTRAKVTAFERIMQQRARGPARKPNAEVPHSA